MQTAGFILASLLCAPVLGQTAATAATGAGAPSAAAAWQVDVALAVLPEAWDHNESMEWFTGVIGGIDRRVWRGVAVRGEGLLLRVAQRGDDGWLRGLTLGTRMRWMRRPARPFIDVAVGVSHSTLAVPPRGTQFNYLALASAGVEMPWRAIVVSLAGRWLHASNNGREGRQRNPDIQSLGVVVGVGWRP